MKTKTLGTIQKVSKAGKILSKIVFIFSLIGAIGCAVGITCLHFLPETFEIGDVTIHNLIEKEAEMTMGTMYASMAIGIVLCVGEAILSKIAERYFKNELKVGTPFTFEGAKELKRLGICAICIPIVTKITAEVTYQVMAQYLQDVKALNIGDPASVGLGIMMIVASLLCKYGAEVTQAPVEN